MLQRIKGKTIPNGWQKVNLHKVTTQIIDGTHSTPNYVEEGIDFYSVESVSRNDFKNVKKITVEEHEKISKRCPVEKGDILMTRIGTLGATRLIDWDVNASIYVSLALLKVKDSVSKRYLYQYTKSHHFQKEVLSRSLLRATPQKINMGDIKKISILIPNDIAEQEKIANILFTWDKAIDLKEKQIKQKKEQKKSLMQKLLNGKVRLPGFVEEWKEIRLGDLLIKHNEKSQLNNQYPVLTSSRRGIFLQKDYYLGNEVASEDNTGYNVVPYGYFTYRHMSDDLTFKFNINDIVEKGIVSTLYPVFTTKKELNSRFLLLKLNEGNEFKRFALKQKQGGSRTYMYYSKLEELKLFVPSLEEQNKIAEYLSYMDKNTQLLEKELDNLQMQKKGLMQLLFTGEIRVKV